MDVPFESTEAIAAAAVSYQEDSEKSALEAAIGPVTEYVSTTPVESSSERPRATIRRTAASIMKPVERTVGRHPLHFTRHRGGVDDAAAAAYATEHVVVDLTLSDEYYDDSLPIAHASATIMKEGKCKKETIEAVALTTTSHEDLLPNHHELGSEAFKNTKYPISAAAVFSNTNDATRRLPLSSMPDDVADTMSKAERHNVARLRHGSVQQKLDRRAMLQFIHKELIPPKPSTLPDFLAAQPAITTKTAPRRSSSRNVPAKDYFKDDAAWVDKDNWDNKVPGKMVTDTKGGEPTTGRQRGRSLPKVADKGDGNDKLEAVGKDISATQVLKRKNSVQSKAVQPTKPSTFPEFLTRPTAAKQEGLTSKVSTEDNSKNEVALMDEDALDNHREAGVAVGISNETDGEPKRLLCRRSPRKSAPNNFFSNGWIDEASWENLLEVAWNDTVVIEATTNNSARTRKPQPTNLHRKSIAQPIPDVEPNQLLIEKGDVAVTETADDHLEAANHRTTTGDPTVRQHVKSLRKAALYDLSQSRCRVEDNVEEVADLTGNGATMKELISNNITKEGPEKSRRHSAPSFIEQKKDKITEMPKQPPAPYILFSQDYRPVFAAQNPNLSHVQIMAAVAKKWVDLSSDEKKPYRDRAAAAVSEFKREMKAWNAFQRSQEKLGRLPATSIRKNATGDFASEAELKAKPTKEKDTTTTKISKPKRQKSLPREPFIQKPDKALPQSRGRLRDRCVGDGVLAMLPADEDAGVPPPQRATSVSARCRMDRVHPRAKSLPMGMGFIRDSLFSTSAPLDEDKAMPRNKGSLSTASNAETRKGNVRSTGAPPDEVAPAPTIVRPFAMSKDSRPITAHYEKSSDIAVSRRKTGENTQDSVLKPSADVEMSTPTTAQHLRLSKKKRRRPDATAFMESRVQEGGSTHFLSNIPPETEGPAQSRAFPLAFSEIKQRRTLCSQKQVATDIGECHDKQRGTSLCSASAPLDADESVTVRTVRFMNSKNNIKPRKTGRQTKGASTMESNREGNQSSGGGETREKIRISTSAKFDLRGNHRSRSYIPNEEILGPRSRNERSNSRNYGTNDEQSIDGSINEKSHQGAGFSTENSLPSTSQSFKNGLSKSNLSGNVRSLSQIFAEDDKQRFDGNADDKSRREEGFLTNTSGAKSPRQHQQNGLNTERFLLLPKHPHKNFDGTFGPHHVAATAARYELDPIQGYMFVISDDAFNNRGTLSRNTLLSLADDDLSIDKESSGSGSMTPVQENTAKAISNMTRIKNKSHCKKKSAPPKSSSPLRKELRGLLISNKLLKAKVADKSNRGASLCQPGKNPSSDGLLQKRRSQTLNHPNHVRLEQRRRTDLKANDGYKASGTVARGSSHGTHNDSARHVRRISGKDIGKRTSSTVGTSESARKKAKSGGMRNFTDDKFLLQLSDSKEACGGSDVGTRSQPTKLYSRDSSRGQLAPLAVYGTQGPTTAEVKVTTSEPRFVACGGCVGCKMKTNCGSCLQCMLQCDAPLCMQRICSAPTPNPKLLANQCHVALNAPSPRKEARKGMIVHKRREQSTLARKERQPSPFKSTRKAQSSGQAYTLTEKSKLTVHARPVANRTTPKKQTGYDIQASVLTESAESTTQGINILLNKSRITTGHSATAHTNHRKRVDDDDSVLESLCDADSFVDDALSDLDDDSSNEAARKSDMYCHVPKQVELSAADMARQWRAEIRGAHTFHPTDFHYDDESYCADE